MKRFGIESNGTPVFIGVRGVSFRVHSQIASSRSRLICGLTTDHGRPASQGPYYDLVYGPVAAFWNQRMSIADADQLSFHTAAAEAVLNKSVRKRII